MSDLAWSHSPKFDGSKRQGRRLLSSVPNEFKMFLQSKIRPVPITNEVERDHTIRRALAIWRLCWQDVPNGWELLDERLCKVLGDSWMESFEKRSGEPVRIP
ncbi:unnamed protein product [Clavelina lepadiformis]|uniref:Uncharacterized protein n=1 Tax=Clavelina lepadiformis TaxID=159417 RepID=A0ABP0F8K5_CLALP